MAKISAFLVDRANYGRLLPLLTALRDCAGVELQLIVGGSMVLERFDRPADLLARDGLGPDRVPTEYVYHEMEGDRPLCKAMSIGWGVCGYASALERQASPWALVIGDRYEALAAATAAVWTGRCLVHVQGGEVSGTLDESARHAITKLAHYHVPATINAARNLVRMGERRETILATGCPVSDAALAMGRAKHLPHWRTALVIYHPDGPDPGRQMRELLEGVDRLDWDQLSVWWPNIDAGNLEIHQALRDFRDRTPQLRTLTNLHPREFLLALREASVCVGNSSSFVRDAGFFGTPVVLVGHRQDGRERAANVLAVEAQASAVHVAIASQLRHGPYAPSTLYGSGTVAPTFIRNLRQATHYTQKRLSYGQQTDPAGANAA